MLEAGVKANGRVRAGQAALMVAASNNLATSVGLRLKHGASVAGVDFSGKTALMYVVTPILDGEFDAQVVRLLLDAGSPIDAQSSSGQTALMMAVRHEEAVRLLLSTNASTDVVDENNWTVLMHAANKGWWIKRIRL